MPLFSVILPTRNRAHLLPFALKSALAQTFQDLEVVVSDNASSDTTQNVVGQFSDPRIRYHRAPTSLSMVDSWEFALSHANGDLVCFLADDDAWSAHLLKSLESAHRGDKGLVATWNVLNYHGPFDSNSAERRNQYVVHPFQGDHSTILSKDALRLIYGFGEGDMPRMLNSCCPRGVVESVRDRFGRFFRPTAPDFTGGLAILATVQQYTHIDLPLSFSGSGGMSPGESPQAFSTFIQDAGVEDVAAPIKLASACNVIADSLYHAKASLAPLLDDVPIDLQAYAVSYYKSLLHYRSRGFEMDGDMKELRAFVRTFSPLDRLSVSGRVAAARIERTFVSSLRRAVLRTPLTSRLAGRISSRKVIRGADAGFEDILGAVEHLDRHILGPRLATRV